MRDGWDVAQICLNGHKINSSTMNMPDQNKAFCDRCGEKTVTNCPNCEKPIRGLFWGDGYSKFQVPAYCDQCGKPFPWTDAKMQAAIELLLHQTGFKGEQADDLKRNIQDVVRDTPRTPVASNRLVKVLRAAPAEIAKAVRDILVDIASESAKKVIWPGS